MSRPRKEVVSDARRLLADVSAGPWTVQATPWSNDYDAQITTPGRKLVANVKSEEDAPFIARAPEIVRELLGLLGERS